MLNVRSYFVLLTGSTLGHGGHLECALQWFGGLSGRPVREVCPTGCGHKCNLFQCAGAFPRIDALRCIPTNDSIEGLSGA